MEQSISETDFIRRSNNIGVVDKNVSDAGTELFDDYRLFLEYFAKNVDPTDQLPVRVPNYTLEDSEITGAIIDWMIQYLTDKKCPQTLVAPVIKLALDQTHQALRKSPEQYGFLASTNEYQTLKLMQLSISKVNDVCQSLLDNLQLDKLIPSPPVRSPPLYSAKGIKNTRRHMEDRHIIIDDFNSIFNVKDSDQTSYYAIFDGHGGTDAAAYSVSHLHCEIVASKYYPAQPAEALREAFLKTDEKFIEKSKKQKLISGATALCALYRSTERQLYVGWAGDSKALLVSQNRVLQIVTPHKPDSESERSRIEESGGCVLEFPSGCFRVNGRLAVSRAIGDYGLKDVVISEPDIVCLKLNGNEDFLLMACDGLWDFVDEDEVALMVYELLEKNQGDIQPIASQVIEIAKRSSSTDNISVIAVFFKDPKQIITEYKSRNSNQLTKMDFESANGLHHLDEHVAMATNNTDCTTAKVVDALTMESNEFYFGKNGADDDFHANINTENSHRSNGDGDKFSSNDAIHEHDDFGPETDVDATDDNAISPMTPTHGYDFIEHVNEDAVVNNDHHPMDFGEEIVKKTDDDLDQFQHQYDDNRFMDHMNEHLVTTTAGIHVHEQQHVEHYNDDEDDDEPELPNKIDFAEKDAFKCQDVDDEDDDDDDDDDDDEMIRDTTTGNQHIMSDVITTDYEQHVLPTNNSVPIENVVVAESGDDSDDGWDYIKVNKDKEEAAAAASADIEQQQHQHLDLEPQLELHQHEDEPELEPEQKKELEHDQFESQQEFQQQETHHFESEIEEAYTKEQQQQFVEDDTAFAYSLYANDTALTPTPPTASLGEIELIHHSEESHAVAQAYAEPEEACSDLLDVKKEENISESGELDLERVERSSSVVAEHDSDLGADQDLEEMDSSSLNPEAAEFVPVSPQRTMSSPLGNGINAINRHDLFDDEIVSQSPRKGTVLDMDNIEVPSDHDFDDGASKCASNLKPEDEEELNASFTGTPANVQLNFETTAAESSNEMNNTQRPESSSSQCSYQEMNLKEAMHGDEKQELAAEVLDTDYTGNMNGGNGVGTDQIDDYSQHPLCEVDPMKMSFYDDGTKSGAFENNNPFKESEVDMNSVQPLPDDVMFEDDNKENGLVGEQHQQQEQQHYEQTETSVEHHYEQQSSVVGHQYENVEHEELAKESASESEKLTLKSEEQYDEQQFHQHHDDKVQEQQSTITQVVQQMASEVTSVLNEFENEYQRNNDVGIPDTTEQQSNPHENNEIPLDVINQSNWSVSANEFKPVNLMSDFGFENNVQMSMPSEAEHFNQSSNEHVEQPFVQIEQQEQQNQQPQFDEPAVEKEIPQSIPSHIETDTVLVEPVPSDLAPAKPTNFEMNSNGAIVAASALGIAAVAVGTAAAVKSAKSPAKSTSTTTTKKPSLTGLTAATKKPLSVSSKTASKPATDIKPKTTTGLSKVAAARAAAPRVTAAAPKSSSITSSSTLTSGVTRKPLSNGISTTIKKTTTTSAKPTNGLSRPATVPSKTLTSRSVSSTTATKTSTSSTVPKTAAAPRVPLSQRSVAPKPATTASKVSATKPAVSSIGSRVKSAPVPSSSTRSTTLTKPKTSATSKLSPTKTASSTTTTTIKKSPISKTTTTTTTKLTPIKRPTTTLTRTTPSKTAAKVPTTNGVASKKLNGHAENGNADNNAIIDLSTV